MTHRLPAKTALLLAALALSGCDWFNGVTGSADTKMENVEILPGTVSDEMITLDAASGDGTAIDTSVAVGPPAPGAPDDTDAPDTADETADDDTPVSSEDGAAAAQPGDVIIRPPAARETGAADKK